MPKLESMSVQSHDTDVAKVAEQSNQKVAQKTNDSNLPSEESFKSKTSNKKVLPDAVIDEVIKREVSNGNIYLKAEPKGNENKSKPTKARDGGKAVDDGTAEYTRFSIMHIARMPESQLSKIMKAVRLNGEARDSHIRAMMFAFPEVNKATGKNELVELYFRRQLGFMTDLRDYPTMSMKDYTPGIQTCKVPVRAYSVFYDLCDLIREYPVWLLAINDIVRDYCKLMFKYVTARLNSTKDFLDRDGVAISVCPKALERLRNAHRDLSSLCERDKFVNADFLLMSKWVKLFAPGFKARSWEDSVK